MEHIRTVKKLAPCSFERIYFSRGSDRDIYRERKLLGTLLTEQILKAVHYDTDNTIFSYIPNTAEVAYYGMLEGLETYLNKKKKKELSALSTESNKAGTKIDDNTLTKILSARIRTEKLAIKDIKLRTFIAEDRSRADLAAHVYDITYGCTREGLDNIVVIDDSIVRGTTLKQSIIKILCRLNPRKIVIVSSAPQIRYPDCYGIAMSSMGEFIAFNATIELLQRSGRTQLILDVYKKCKEQEQLPKEKIVNYVKEIYASFTDEDISRQIANMVRPDDCDMDIEIVFQTIGNLHVACKEHSGDWYFSGNYPTPGGNRLVNSAFIHYVETNYATIQSNIKLIYTE
ncbi:hypothetical protein FACS1894195_4650 [Bacteroidia bacterium]|nr:hypothetical protein FACS1894195_4650 [Bacteroidia bacterium]